MSPLLHPMSCMGCHSPAGRGLAGEVPPGVTVKHQEGTGPSAWQADPDPIACSLPPILGELLLLQAGLVTLVYLSNFTLLKLNLCSSFSLIP